MDSLRELSTIALTIDLPEYGLTVGDVGTIVHSYQHSMVYEVEFVTGMGETIALLQLNKQDVRLLNQHEILHVRALA